MNIPDATIVSIKDALKIRGIDANVSWSEIDRGHLKIVLLDGHQSYWMDGFISALNAVGFKTDISIK